MGFNKRYLNENTILRVYEESGMDGLSKYFNSDAIFMTNDFCFNVYEAHYNDDHKTIKELILNKKTFKNGKV